MRTRTASVWRTDTWAIAAGVRSSQAAGGRDLTASLPPFLYPLPDRHFIDPAIADIDWSNMTITTTTSSPDSGRQPKPLLDAKQASAAAITMWVFVVLPFVALLGAIPLAWGWGVSLLDLAMAGAIYVIAGFGVTVGFHRYLTHGSFKANRALRIALAVAGSLAVQGSPAQWVANHRRHHAFSDRDGDPHS
ncbi:MAG: fatty acid desaturase, partial [Dehalococcoidia bacterium]